MTRQPPMDRRSDSKSKKRKEKLRRKGLSGPPKDKSMGGSGIRRSYMVSK